MSFYDCSVQALQLSMLHDCILKLPWDWGDPAAAKRTVFRAVCRPICGDGVARMLSMEKYGEVEAGKTL